MAIVNEQVSLLSPRTGRWMSAAGVTYEIKFVCWKPIFYCTNIDSFWKQLMRVAVKQVQIQPKTNLYDLPSALL